MTKGANPAIRRQQLGMELRRLREAAGLTTYDVGDRLEDMSSVKVGRLERGGTQRPKIRDIEALLQLYGVDPATIETLLDLARAAKEPDWWHVYGDGASSLVRPLVALEDVAERIRSWQCQLVPGLLQTEDYARAVLHTNVVEPPEVVERWVEFRMARRQILDRDSPPMLWAMLDESVLHRSIGGPEVMRDQLVSLVATCRERSQVTVQIVPYAAGEHPGIGLSFVLLDPPNPGETPPAVYLDGYPGAMCTSKDREVQRVNLMWEHLRAKALAPEASLAMIEEIAST